MRNHRHPTPSNSALWPADPKHSMPAEGDLISVPGRGLAQVTGGSGGGSGARCQLLLAGEELTLPGDGDARTGEQPGSPGGGSGTGGISHWAGDADGADGRDWAVGDRVLARYHGRGTRFFAGVVTRVYAAPVLTPATLLSGEPLRYLLDIAYDDGDEEVGVVAEDVLRPDDDTLQQSDEPLLRPDAALPQPRVPPAIGAGDGVVDEEGGGLACGADDDAAASSWMGLSPLAAAAVSSNDDESEEEAPHAPLTRSHDVHHHLHAHPADVADGVPPFMAYPAIAASPPRGINTPLAAHAPEPCVDALGHPLRVGDGVHARFRRRSRQYFPGVVTRVVWGAGGGDAADGGDTAASAATARWLVDVSYDDGDEDNGLHTSCVLAAPSASAMPASVGRSEPAWGAERVGGGREEDTAALPREVGVVSGGSASPSAAAPAPHPPTPPLAPPEWPPVAQPRQAGGGAGGGEADVRATATSSPLMPVKPQQLAHMVVPPEGRALRALRPSSLVLPAAASPAVATRAPACDAGTSTRGESPLLRPRPSTSHSVGTAAEAGAATPAWRIQRRQRVTTDAASSLASFHEAPAVLVGDDDACRQPSRGVTRAWATLPTQSAVPPLRRPLQSPPPPLPPPLPPPPSVNQPLDVAALGRLARECAAIRSRARPLLLRAFHDGDAGTAAEGAEACSPAPGMLPLPEWWLLSCVAAAARALGDGAMGAPPDDAGGALGGVVARTDSVAHGVHAAGYTLPPRALAVLRSAFRLRSVDGDRDGVAGEASGGGIAAGTVTGPGHATLLVLPLVVLLCGEPGHAEAVLRHVDGLAHNRAHSRAGMTRQLRSGGWSARLPRLGTAAEVSTRG